MATSFQVTFECADPELLAAFWAAALHHDVQAPPEGYATWSAFLAAQGVPEVRWNSASAIVDPDGAGPRIFFQRVPEPKSAKNRVDLDISGGPSVSLDERRRRVSAEVERLAGIGSTRMNTHDEDDQYWIVMADAEGNEFCLQ